MASNKTTFFLARCAAIGDTFLSFGGRFFQFYWSILLSEREIVLPSTTGSQMRSGLGWCLNALCYVAF